MSLHLEYLSTDQSLELFVDNLNVYNTCTDFTIEDCKIYDFAFLKKFKRLKNVKLDGTRFWHLALSDFPESIESIDIRGCINTHLFDHNNRYFFDNLNNLHNLKELYIGEWFIDIYEQQFPYFPRDTIIFFDFEGLHKEDGELFDSKTIIIQDGFQKAFPHNKIIAEHVNKYDKIYTTIKISIFK